MSKMGVQRILKLLTSWIVLLFLSPAQIHGTLLGWGENLGCILFSSTVDFIEWFYLLLFVPIVED
jgi:hypothetical protein